MTVEERDDLIERHFVNELSKEEEVLVAQLLKSDFEFLREFTIQTRVVGQIRLKQRIQHQDEREKLSAFLDSLPADIPPLEEQKGAPIIDITKGLPRVTAFKINRWYAVAAAVLVFGSLGLFLNQRERSSPSTIHSPDLAVREEKSMDSQSLMPMNSEKQVTEQPMLTGQLSSYELELNNLSKRLPFTNQTVMLQIYDFRTPQYLYDGSALKLYLPELPVEVRQWVIVRSPSSKKTYLIDLKSDVRYPLENTGLRENLLQD